jgi:hypothetical protein
MVPKKVPAANAKAARRSNIGGIWGTARLEAQTIKITAVKRAAEPRAKSWFAAHIAFKNKYRARKYNGTQAELGLRRSRQPLPHRNSGTVKAKPVRGKKSHVSLGMIDVRNGLRKKIREMIAPLYGAAKSDVEIGWFDRKASLRRRR